MGAIQSSINTALGVAAIASGLTNKKEAEKAKNKLDDKTKELVNKEVQLASKEEDLAKTTAEKEKQAKTLSEYKDEQNMKYGGNTYNASNDLPTAKETNIDNAGDKIDVINNNSINKSIGSSMKDYLKANKKVDPYTYEQIMGFHALKMADSMAMAKRAVKERTRRVMLSPQARAARAERDKNGGNE